MMETIELLKIAVSLIAIACAISLIWHMYNNTPPRRWERMNKQAEKDRKRMIKH